MLRAYAWIGPFEMLVDDLFMAPLGTGVAGRLRSGDIKDEDQVNVWRDGELVGTAEVALEPNMTLPLTRLVLHSIDGCAPQAGDVLRAT
ncbi:MAG TPA: hypothetical protein VME46_03785 [Acidimicrobiales bacterium]|nr:hypothetical protein [Acidimicrobiales bacterium]